MSYIGRTNIIKKTFKLLFADKKLEVNAKCQVQIFIKPFPSKKNCFQGFCFEVKIRGQDKAFKSHLKEEQT